MFRTHFRHLPHQSALRFVSFLILSVLLLFAQTLLAQTLPVPPDSVRRVYIYVEQMPELPGKPVVSGIMRELQELLEPAARGDKRAFVTFTVGPSGCVYGAKIIKGVSAAADAAVLRAVARLPRFVPGKQNGRAVSVSFTVPVAVK